MLLSLISFHFKYRTLHQFSRGKCWVHAQVGAAVFRAHNQAPWAPTSFLPLQSVHCARTQLIHQMYGGINLLCTAPLKDNTSDAILGGPYYMKANWSIHTGFITKWTKVRRISVTVGSISIQPSGHLAPLWTHSHNWYCNATRPPNLQPTNPLLTAFCCQ